jgi:hypothetical protein
VKLIALLTTTAVLTSIGAFAQTGDNTKPAIKTGSENSAPAPVAGKTSFTAGEAKARMEKRGYKVPGDPVKDTQGIWYADAANADGKSVKLLVDYQGNVFERSASGAPASGKTSMTADAARTSMEKRGYNVTSNPIRDDNGIWYAEASKKDGQTVQVMVDYQGSVFESGVYAGHPSSAPGVEPGLPNPIRKAPQASGSSN